MKECMETDKPLVSIVMATYNPRMDWLKEQLISLENQTYRPLELLILDDCSTEVELDKIRRCVAECIVGIPYQIMQNEVNLGSTKTFEKLTMLAGGEYIAYCDQDDVWHEDKLESLFRCFTNENVNLAFSDVQIIDESGNKLADSITEYRKRHVLYEGSCLSDKLLIQNFVIGCTMLIKRNIALESIPFVTDMVHDHYLALMASLNGELTLCRKPLVDYRIHRGNQTNTLGGINSKKDYYNNKIKAFYNRVLELEERRTVAAVPEFFKIKKWTEARDSYYKGRFVSAKDIWKYRGFDVNISIFELIMAKMPDLLFKYTLNLIKKGKL